MKKEIVNDTKKDNMASSLCLNGTICGVSRLWNYTRHRIHDNHHDSADHWAYSDSADYHQTRKR